MVEAVVSAENTNHVAAIVILEGNTPIGTQNRCWGQRNEFALADQHGMHNVPGVFAATNDFAFIVNAVSSGALGSGTVDANECESFEFTVIVPAGGGCGASGIVDAGGCELGITESDGD